MLRLWRRLLRLVNLKFLSRGVNMFTSPGCVVELQWTKPQTLYLTYACIQKQPTLERDKKKIFVAGYEDRLEPSSMSSLRSQPRRPPPTLPQRPPVPPLQTPSAPIRWPPHQPSPASLHQANRLMSLSVRSSSWQQIIATSSIFSLPLHDSRCRHNESSIVPSMELGKT